MLVLKIKAGQSIRVGGTVITFVSSVGKSARLGFKADEKTKIIRIKTDSPTPETKEPNHDH